MFSVIIPTRNRSEKLSTCLRSLEQLNTPIIQEIIVVDDHSDEQHREHSYRILAQLNLAAELLKNQGTGPAAARNTGIRAATASIVLFLGDDMIAGPDLVNKHAEFHETYGDPENALVGRITWKPGLRITPLMHWLENGGPQFGFPECTSRCPTEYRFFYSSNASLKKKFLETHGLFDEEFPFASFEDTELAYRLYKRGKLSLYYDPETVVYHDHPMSFTECCNRMKRVGYSAKLLVKKHPELQSLFVFMDDIINARFKNFVRLCCFPMGYLFRSEKILHPFFWQVMAKHFMTGYNGDLKDVSTE